MIRLDAIDPIAASYLIGRSPEYQQEFCECLRGEVQRPIHLVKRRDSKKPGEGKAKAESLILKSIRSVYPSAKAIRQLSFSGNVANGYFSDPKKTVFRFEIDSETGRISYGELDLRQDKKADDCKKGMRCGNACVPKGSRCEGQLSPTAQKAAQVAARMWLEEDLPTRREVAQLAGAAAKEFLQNPVKFIREGNQREQQAREMVAQMTGKELASRAELAEQAKEAAIETIKDPEFQIKYGTMIGGNALGAAAGAAFGNPVISIATEAASSSVIRRGLTDFHEWRAAQKTLEVDEAFQSASRLEKIGMIKDETVTRLEAKKKVLEQEVASDIGGAIGGGIAGTLAGSAARSLGAGGLIPVAAGVTAGVLVSARTGNVASKVQESLQEGATPKQAAKTATKAIAEQVESDVNAAKATANLPKTINEAEVKARKSTKQKIRRVKRSTAVAPLVTAAAVAATNNQVRSR